MIISKFVDAYEKETGNVLPNSATKLDGLFNQIENNENLPPRGQQSVDAGFTAHTLVDPTENRVIYQYYQWIINQYLFSHPVRELTAKPIGTSFVSANLFKSNLPQPLTLNPWQTDELESISLMSKRAVIIENNGVFILLHKKHPDWPLINQSGNDFNPSYNKVLKYLSAQNIKMTYLGDLDSEGIRIADHLSGILDSSTSNELFEIQSPSQVVEWLVLFGKENSKRTKNVIIKDKLLKQELESITSFNKFVEQEQLISEYEKLIVEWLKKY